MDLFYAFCGLASHPIATYETLFPNYNPFLGRRFSPATDIGSLAGKVILVTGGNNGLGKETVLQLAKHSPHKIFLAARNEQKARDAIESIQNQLLEEVDIEHIPLDLASLQSVKAASEIVKSRSERLDIVVLNAGAMALPPETTDAGFEIHMGTNHFGHHLLTKLLMPMLKKTAAEPDSDVRVVSVASEGYRLAPVIETITSTTDLLSASPLTRYAASKAANILFAAEFARRHPEITSVSLHPGVILTELYHPGSREGLLAVQVIKLSSFFIAQNIPEGALTQIWAAAGAMKGELTNGGYYTVEKLRDWNPWVKDKQGGRDLWDWTESELRKAGY